MNSLPRRSFLRSSIALTAASAVVAHAPNAFSQIENKIRRVGVIGHTGRGNFGHGLDTVWLKVSGAEIVGVADANDAGLTNALKTLNVDPSGGFTDYREMLKSKRPEYVAVCSRHPDQHAAMTIAAIEAGARGVYVEKPVCRTPAEADDMLAAANKHGAKIAVAHRNRYHPALPVIEKRIADETIGKLLEIRGRGKGDRRGGGEDLWVLGSHVLNLAHFFGGDPLTCSATMLQDGRRVTENDVRDGAEGLGPLAGNELHARYEMSSGVVVYFDSIANDDTDSAGFGLQLVGSRGIISIACDRDPLAHLVPGNPFLADTENPRPWIPITSGGIGAPEPNPAAVANAQNHVAPVIDLIAACESEDDRRTPLCDGKAAAKTVEMICAVFESHRLESAAVPFPLAQRDNALDLL
ncbi:MAG: Gfo/Idh/MocA family oxidoreductase [Candidatus Paceibacterota bacterium]